MKYLIVSGCNDNYIFTMIDFIENYKANNLAFNNLRLWFK